MKKFLAAVLLIAIFLSIFTACAEQEEPPEPGLYIDSHLYTWWYVLKYNWLAVDGDRVIYNENYNNVNRYIKGRLVVSDQIHTIGEKAFDGRYQLDAVVLPDTVRELETGALSGLVNVTEFLIPEWVTEIPDNCFSGDKKLKNVFLPKAVEYIGSSAFDGCERLYKITFNGTKRRWKKVRLAEGALDGSKILCAECTNGRVYINKNLEEAPEAVRNCAIWFYDIYGGFGDIDRLPEAEIMTVEEHIRGKQSLEDFNNSYVIYQKGSKGIPLKELKTIVNSDIIVKIPTVILGREDYCTYVLDGGTKKVLGMFIPNHY